MMLLQEAVLGLPEVFAPLEALIGPPYLKPPFLEHSLEVPDLLRIQK